MLAAPSCIVIVAEKGRSRKHPGGNMTQNEGDAVLSPHRLFLSSPASGAGQVAERPGSRSAARESRRRPPDTVAVLGRTAPRGE